VRNAVHTKKSSEALTFGGKIPTKLLLFDKNISHDIIVPDKRDRVSQPAQGCGRSMKKGMNNNMNVM
jgi:hypothetical protein